MLPGWLAAAIACVLGVALAIVAMPPPPTDDGFEPAASDDVEIVAARVRETGIAERPAWEVGDAWLVQFGEDGIQCWAAVVSADASGHQHGFSCDDEDTSAIVATQVVGFDVGTFVGRLGPDLQGYMGDDEVVFFDWPLSDGKRWTTSWGGEDVEVTAAYDGDRFQLTMCYVDGDGECLAAYDYVPELEWWSEIRFESGYVFSVLDRDPEWHGTAISGAGEERFEMRRSLTQQLPVRPAFTVEAVDDMLFATVRRAGLFAHRFDFLDPDGNSMWSDTATSNGNIVGSGSGSFLSNQFPANEGVWTLDDQFLSAGEALYRVLGVDLTTHEL